MNTSLYIQAIKTTTEALHLENLIINDSLEEQNYQIILLAREIVTKCLKLEMELAKL